MYSSEFVYSLRDQFATTGYCNVLTEEVHQFITGTTASEERFLREDWTDSNQCTYSTYCIDTIATEHRQHSVAFIELANSSGEEKTFVHTFVLFRTEQGVLRLEAYGKEFTIEFEEDRPVRRAGPMLYSSRVVPWPDWPAELAALIRAEPGTERLALWNRLFSAEETADTDYPLEIALITR